MNQKPWGCGPALRVLLSQSGDSDAPYSLRIDAELWEQLNTPCFFLSNVFATGQACATSER